MSLLKWIKVGKGHTSFFIYALAITTVGRQILTLAGSFLDQGK